MRWGWKPALAAVVLGAAACATARRIAALRNVEFELAGVAHARLAGVSVERIAGYRDLSPAEVGRLALAATGREVPLDFEVQVRALNPAANGTVATLTRFAWSLLIDDREAVSGVIDSTITFPPGQAVVVPVRVHLDLRRFFDGPAQGLVDLAASLAGVRADPTRITLRAVPTVSTPLGPITYPNPITILNRTVGQRAAPSAVRP
jgi:hypothetical protein